MEEENYGDDMYYVGVENPNKVRKEILESQKALILNLKRLEGFKDIKEKKLVLMYEFTKTLREIGFLNTKLRGAMPKAGIRAASAKKIIRQRVGEKEGRLKRLESQLDDVEGQLGELLP